MSFSGGKTHSHHLGGCIGGLEFLHGDIEVLQKAGNSSIEGTGNGIEPNMLQWHQLHTMDYGYQCAIIHSFIHLFIHSFIHSCIHSCMHSFIHSLIHSFHVMSCHVMSCHVMSCHVMSCHVMSCHVLSIYLRAVD